MGPDMASVEGALDADELQEVIEKLEILRKRMDAARD